MNAAAAEAGWLLEGRGVTRRFGGLVAVDRVDLAVRRSSVHGLIGPNGAGKTTLLNLIAGAYRPSGGALRFGARDITRDPPGTRARAGKRPLGSMTMREGLAPATRRTVNSGSSASAVPIPTTTASTSARSRCKWSSPSLPLI